MLHWQCWHLAQSTAVPQYSRKEALSDTNDHFSHVILFFYVLLISACWGPAGKNSPWIYCSMLFHLSFWSINYQPRQVLHNPSLIDFSAFQSALFLIMETSSVIYSRPVIHLLAIGSHHGMNHKLIHSMTDLLWQAESKSPGVLECREYLEIKTFGNSHGVIYVSVKCCCCIFSDENPPFLFFFFFKLFKKSLKKKSTGFKSTIKHSFYGPLWSEFVFDCTLTTKLSLTEDILQLQKLYKDVDTVEFVH